MAEAFPCDEKDKEKGETKKVNGATSKDEELDDLLDSALKDFEAQDVKQKPQQSTQKPNTTTSADGVKVDTSELLADEFSDELAKQFQEAMQGIVGNDKDFLQQMEKLAEAAGKSGESPEAQQDFAKTLSSTLNSLAENTEGLQDDVSDEDLMKAFTSMGMEDSPDNIMQGMMKTLLSKEVLYPSLKELSQKYPKWISDNLGKIEKSQMANYEQQEILVREICTEFEKEHASDSTEVQKHRFETIVDLMQQMQELGQPPKEIVGDMAPGLEFDENGMPKMPGAPEGCAIM